MAGSAFQPIQLPEWARRSEEASAVLRARDAAGILQGRVSEILKGNRKVTALEVFERIADGLNMPDDACVTLGLAPRYGGRAADGSLPSTEITRVFPDQAAAASEIRLLARQATAIDVLAVRGLGLLGLNHSLLRGALTNQSREAPLRLRVLLLDPDSPAARQRAAEIGEPPESLASGIRFTLARLQEFAGTAAVALEVYDRLPVWRLLDIDATLYVGAFAEAWEGHQSPLYKLAGTPAGMLHHALRRTFEDLRQHAKPII